MALSTPNGLMVPVMRDCDKKSFAEIEKTLSDLAAKGRDGKLSLEEMSGGTFTITNGGVFGSLMRSEEHTSELQSLMRISYAVFCLKKKTLNNNITTRSTDTREDERH